jgi:uncharacterized membrane protein (DUF485 family)
MKPYSRHRPRKPLSRINSRNSALLNQLATPGLGSVLAGRIVAGIGQLMLAVTGFTLVVAWFIKVLIQFYSLMDLNSNVQPRSVAWLGLTGFGVFAAAWLWALVTSLGILREGRRSAAAEFEKPIPPRWDSA